MGLIGETLSRLRKNKHPEKSESEIQDDIESYRRQQRQQMKVDAIMQHEKAEFLYGKGNEQHD